MVRLSARRSCWRRSSPTGRSWSASTTGAVRCRVVSKASSARWATRWARRTRRGVRRGLLRADVARTNLASCSSGSAGGPGSRWRLPRGNAGRGESVADARRRLPSLNRSYPARVGSWPASVSCSCGKPRTSTGRMDARSRDCFNRSSGQQIRLLSRPETPCSDPTTGSPTLTRWSECPATRSSFAFGRDEDGLRLRLPGMDLSTPRLVDGPDEVAFVVALLWVTTSTGWSRRRPGAT